MRRCLQRYARWLREQVKFPVRVPVYLSPRKRLVTLDGGRAFATCFLPFDRREEPYIRIATGEYVEARRKQGRDSALASYIDGLSHEIVHYRQRIERKPLTERGVDRKARAMVNAYMKCVDRPLETRDSDNAFIGEWNDRLQEHLDRGRWPEAKRMLRRTVARWPKNHLGLYGLAYCEYRQRRYVPALRVIRRAHALKPRCPAVLRSYAHIALANGKPKLALGLCELILARTLRSLASGACGEGLSAARKLRTDARALAKRCR